MSTPLSKLYQRPSTNIRLEHISHIVGETNYARIYFVDGSQVLFGRTLKLYERGYPSLIRITKKELINPASITRWEYINKRNLRVFITGTGFWVSRRRVEVVANRLAQALGVHVSQE